MSGAACAPRSGAFPYCIDPDNQKFYTLASELGVVMAPAILSPSETLGFAGFAITAHVDFTTISTKKDYWMAAESYQFEDNDPSQPQTADSKAPSETAKTIGMTVRKGLWLPVPSFEVGLGFVHLLDSSLFAPQLDAKLSLHEGFHNWPLPEIAVRGTASRVMGQTAFDLTTAGLDFSASKQFGIQGTVNLTPFAGYQILWIIADSDVMDGTPNCDPVVGSTKNPNCQPPDPAVTAPVCSSADCNANFVFFDPDPIVRNRIFVGFRLNFDPATFALAAAFTLAGGSTDKYLDPVGGEEEIRVHDKSPAQQTYSASLGLDF
ncbi:MAG: hypothetical protein AABZ30_11550 [Myxococcota bacterium]